MLDDFSESQRQIIVRITNEAIERVVSRPEPIEGELRLPDTARTYEIANEAIGAWSAARPPWWDIRRRLDTKLAGGGLVAVLILAFVDALVIEQDIILPGIHRLAGTDARVDTRMVAMAEDWGNGATSVSGVAMQTAFYERLDDWAAGTPFTERSRDVLGSMATAEAPELIRLVQRALGSQPILMFHGQALLGSVAPVEVENDGCQALVGYWFDSRPENLPKAFRADDPDESLAEDARFELEARKLGRLSAACAARGQMSRDDNLNVPFWARFHPGKDGRKDEVYLLLHVRRTLSEVTTEAIASLTREGVRPLDSEGIERVATGTHPFASKVKGLGVDYLATDPVNTEAIDLSASLQYRGEGFYFGRIDEHIAASTEPPQGKQALFELFHSLAVSLPALSLEAGETYCDSSANDPEAPDPDPACLDEVVQVVAMIMVNKEP